MASGFALVVEDDDLRMQIFLVLDDDHGFLAGGFIHFLLHGDAFDDVVELHLAGLLGKNRDVVRIPLHEGVALLDLAAVLDGDDRADDDVVRFQFAAVVAEDGDGAVLVQDDVVAVFELDEAQVVVADRAVELGLDLRLLEHLAEAVPPMWNVRMVSCVPGSPMDCAAMMPMASPSLTSAPVARLRP